MIFFVGAPLSVLNFWSAVEMRLKIPSDNYHIYMERNVTMVQKQHEDSQSAWFYQVLPWKTQTIKINIFEQTCVGILTRDSYKISLMVKNVDYSFCKYYFISRSCFLINFRELHITIIWNSNRNVKYFFPRNRIFLKINFNKNLHLKFFASNWLAIDCRSS